MINHQRKNTKNPLVLRTMFLLVAVMLLITGCSGNDSLMTAVKKACQAAGISADVNDINIYVYHFQGTDEINRQGDTTLEAAFGLSSEQMPENGYFIIISDKRDSNVIFTLQNMNGTILETVDSAYELTLVRNTSYDHASCIDQAGADFANGLISESEVKANLMIDIERREAILRRLEALISYGRSAACAVSVYAGYQESKGDAINEWHILTEKQIRQVMK